MPQDEMYIPPHATACLILADGTVFFGEGIGKPGITGGEICFNTAMSGYQEVMTDPSYAGQIITFTFPHIGNVGCNDEDIEATKPYANGLVLRERPTRASNFRSHIDFDEWLKRNNLTGICGVDTRALTRHIRKAGAQNAAIQYITPKEKFDFDAVEKLLDMLPDMNGLDLAKQVTTVMPYQWIQTRWKLGEGYGKTNAPRFHVVAVDFGEKLNILRSLAERDCRITIVPAESDAETILSYKPDGIFLSNGPGDPAATGQYAIPTIKTLVDSGTPVFGICLGHQLLGIAMGGKTEKMPQGHRGANHPVKDLKSGKVIITSQNHGFVVSKDNLPADVEITHVSLFDQTIQGLRHKKKPVFCVQGHPEASPGPHDSQYLFDDFVAMMQAKKDVTSDKWQVASDKKKGAV